MAIILGSRGHRVLVVDLDLPAPSLHRYLSAFLPADLPATWTPVPLNIEFENQRGAVSLLSPAVTRADSPGFSVRRADLIAEDYDYVLVDAPSGATAEVAAVTEELADVLVLGYSPSRNAVDGAVERAAAVYQSGRGRAIRLLPVPMHVDQRDAGMTQRMLGEGQRRLKWLLDGMEDEDQQQYWLDVEIPYEPRYSAEESLPVLEDSAREDRLVSAYTKLADRVASSGPPDAPGVVTAAARERYLISRSTAAGSSAPVTVLHVGADRGWAEWIVTELDRLGLSARRQRLGPGPVADVPPGHHLLFVLSQRLLDMPTAGASLAAASHARATYGRTALAVSIDRSQLPAGQFPPSDQLQVSSWPERKTRHELGAYFGLSARPARAERGAGEPRYPGHGRAPGRSNLLPRVKAFYGREDALDRIRDHFSSGSGRPLALTGPPGIGKSQLAQEYAHRFAAQYNLVYLIRAENAETAREGMAALTRPGSSGAAPLADVGELSVHADESRRWLIIFDGADDIASLPEVLSAARRDHVLVTSRSAGLDALAQSVVQPLDPDEAEQMIMGLIPELLPAAASSLASDLHHVPLALDLAAAWVNVVNQNMRAAGMDPATVTVNTVTEFRDQLALAAVPDGVARLTETRALELTVGLLVDLLRNDDQGAAAMVLLETCALLSPLGMSKRLLRSPEMLSQLRAADDALTDPIVLLNVLRRLVRYGLALAGEAEDAPLLVHPLILAVLRRRLAAEQLRVRSAAVAQLLAANAPVSISENTLADAEVYAELQQHLEASEADRYTDPEVRRWLVNQVRYLWQTGLVSNWELAADLGRRLVETWEQSAPDGPDDQLLLRLRMQLGNVYRSLCDFERAREIDEATLTRQRRVLGLRHLRTLVTAGGYASDLRVTGNFRDALLEDHSTWLALVQSLGEDDVMTIIASSNMAVSELVNGEPESALQRQQEDLRRSRHLDRRVQEGHILSNMGMLLREVGRYAESRNMLREATMVFRDLVRQGSMAPTERIVLRVQAGLAISRRRLGEPSLEVIDEVLGICRDTYGDKHPDVLAAILSRAGALHAEGRHQEAVSDAQRALAGHRAVFGPDSPFTRQCQVDLSIYALAAGSVELAEEISQQAWSALENALGRSHLWTLAAGVAHANALAIAGHLDAAQELEDYVLVEYRRRMGPQHSFTHAAELNASHTRLLLNNSEKPTLADAMKRRAIELDVPPY